MSRIELAQKMAHEAHDSIGQKRKYSGLPYWTHTDQVAAIVSETLEYYSVFGYWIQPGMPGYDADKEDMICAAHNHDVLEDVMPLMPTKYNYSAIEYELGPAVAKMVSELTDEYISELYTKLPRAERKRMERERIGKISSNSKTVKLADILSNAGDIGVQDPEFAKIYLVEKHAMMAYLTDGNAGLYMRTMNQILMKAKEIGLTL